MQHADHMSLLNWLDNCSSLTVGKRMQVISWQALAFNVLLRCGIILLVLYKILLKCLSRHREFILLLGFQ